MVVIVNLHSDRFVERCEIFVARKAACLTLETAKPAFHEPILRPNARNEIFGGSPPTRPAELLRRITMNGVMAKINCHFFDKI